MANIVLLAAIGLPVLLLLILRSNAAIVFLSLCAGSLLGRYVVVNGDLALSALNHNRIFSSTSLQIGLLIVPVILSAVLLARSMAGTKMIFNILPAIGVGLVGVLLLVPALPSSLQNNLTASNGWMLLERFQQIVVGGSVGASLLVLWLTSFRGREHGHRKHH